MTQLSDPQIAAYAVQAGFRGNALVVAVAVAIAESSGNTSAVNHNTNGSTDRGLWQINSIHTQYDANRLFDPSYNAQAAYELSGGGTNFQPWSVFNSGAYRQYMSRALVGATGSPTDPSNVPPSSAANSPAHTPDVIPPQPPSLDFGYLPALTLDGIRIEGLHPFAQGGFSESLFAATVDLASTEASEITVRFLDPASQLIAQNFIDVGVNVRWQNLDMRCKEFGVVDNDGIQAVELVAAARGVEELKQLVLDAPPAGQSPTQLLQDQCARVGLGFYGEGSPSGIEVQEVDRNPLPGKGSTTKGPETVWEYASRRAGELGFWLFESTGTVWFARPSWLVQYTTRVRVGVNNAWGDERLDVQGVPTCRAVAVPGGVVNTTVTLQLPRWFGEQVRPGMGLDLKGVDPSHSTTLPRPSEAEPGDQVDGSLHSTGPPSAVGSGPPIPGEVGQLVSRQFPRASGFDRLYVATRVTWDATSDAVTVEATEPRDPATPVFTNASATGEMSTFPGGNYAGATRISDWGTFEYVAIVGRYVRDFFGVREIGGYRPDPYPDHPSRKAIDFMVFGDRAKGDQIKDFLLKVPQTKYVIWQQHLWYPGGHGDHDMADRGSATQNHRDHVHWLSN